MLCYWITSSASKDVSQGQCGPCLKFGKTIRSADMHMIMHSVLRAQKNEFAKILWILEAAEMSLKLDIPDARAGTPHLTTLAQRHL